MEAVRKRAAETGDDKISATMATTNRKNRELRENDLRTISMYRQQTKHEDIAHHLMNFITREVHIRLMPGHVEFFEYVLQNPYPEQHSISIACDDDELRSVSSIFRGVTLNCSFVSRLVSWQMLENGIVWNHCSVFLRTPKWTCSPIRLASLIRVDWNILRSSCVPRNLFTSPSNCKHFSRRFLRLNWKPRRIRSHKIKRIPSSRRTTIRSSSRRKSKSVPSRSSLRERMNGVFLGTLSSRRWDTDRYSCYSCGIHVSDRWSNYSLYQRREYAFETRLSCSQSSSSDSNR